MNVIANVRMADEERRSMEAAVIELACRHDGQGLRMVALEWEGTRWTVTITREPSAEEPAEAA